MSKENANPKTEETVDLQKASKEEAMALLGSAMEQLSAMHDALAQAEGEEAPDGLSEGLRAVADMLSAAMEEEEDKTEDDKDEEEMEKSDTPENIVARLEALAQKLIESGQNIPDQILEKFTKESLKVKKELDIEQVPEEQREAVEKLRKAHEDQNAEMEKLRAELEAERHAREVKENFEHVSKNYSNVPRAVSEEFARDLTELRKKAPEETTRLEEILKAADEAIKNGALFEESGTSQTSDAVTAWEKICQEADEVVQKDASMTTEKARTLVMKRRPELREQYLAERKAI